MRKYKKIRRVNQYDRYWLAQFLTTIYGSGPQRSLFPYNYFLGMPHVGSNQ